MRFSVIAFDRTNDFKSPNTSINGVLVTDKDGLILASMYDAKGRTIWKTD